MPVEKRKPKLEENELSTCDYCGEELNEWEYNHHRCLPDDYSNYPQVGTVIESAIAGPVKVTKNTAFIQCQECREWVPEDEMLDHTWAPPDLLRACGWCQ